MSRFWSVCLRGMTAVALVGLVGGCATTRYPDVSEEGMAKEKASGLRAVYQKPGQDFRRFDRFTVEECEVALRKNWKRDHNRNRDPGRRLTDKDVEKILDTAAARCRAAFVEELRKVEGYEVVDGSGTGILTLRPSLFDLDVAAPDVMSAGRSRSYTTSAVSMRLELELYAGSGGELVGRVLDRQESTDSGRMQWATSGSNQAEADRILRRWAVAFRDYLGSLEDEAE